MFNRYGLEDRRLPVHAHCGDHPIYVAGDYVFHCHIGEHTDGGMMARIRVRILGQN
jgi:Multicopper oxidase